MNKVTEEEIQYDIDKTLQISKFVNCVHKSTISHPRSIMETTGTNKDGGLLQRMEIKKHHLCC